MERVRLLLLDDHMLFRESLSRLLESEADFEIAGHCSSVQEALDVLRRRSVDVVLLDFDLGQESAFQFIGRLRELPAQPKILMVTAGMSDAEAVQLIGQGVSGIFLKQSSPALLTEAIRKVMAGEMWLDQNSARLFVQAASQDAGQRPPEFTEREREVLRGVFEGLTNKEIATRLSISESTVKAGLQQLFQKTGVRTRSQLVRIALEQYAGQWQ
jgi:DNA-binding NarL/FixJ family response regulator